MIVYTKDPLFKGSTVSLIQIVQYKVIIHHCFVLQVKSTVKHDTKHRETNNIHVFDAQTISHFCLIFVRKNFN